MTATVQASAGVEFRPITEGDGPDLVASFDMLSDESRLGRFFYQKRMFAAEELHRFTHCDGVQHAAFIARQPEADVSPLIAVARWVRLPDRPGVADVAYITRDDWQRRGVGRQLIRHLAAHARSQSLTHFRAQILWGNTGARKILESAGTIVEHVPLSAGVSEWLCRL